MKFKIYTKDKEKCREALDIFINQFNEDFPKVKDEKFKNIAYIPDIVYSYEETDYGFLLMNSVSLPFFMKPLQKKIISGTKSFLKEHGIKIDRIEYERDLVFL